jgi:lipoyl(octanoyl) transferase
VPSALPELWVCQLGTVEYREGVALQERVRAARQAGRVPDVMLLLEHWPVYTRGRRSAPGELPMGEDWYLMQGIEIAETDRGGKVTYHGPGQLVFYPLVQLRRRGLDVRQLVSALERSVIAWLADLGIAAATRAGAPGVYVGDAKIASLGLRIRRGRSYHGLAVNVAMDLEPFARINPCGYAGLRMTQVADLLPAARVPALDAAQRALLGQLARELGYTGWDPVAGAAVDPGGWSDR